MASRQVLLLAAAAVVAVACLPALASGVQWKVGDEGGWRAKFNETNWADGKTFTVGDTLLFTYTKGDHTVIQVGGDDFRACNLQANHLGAWYDGSDAVPLDKPGKMWFICDKPNHCNNGMKLVVDVLDAAAPTPTSPESSAPASYTVGGAVAAAGFVLAAVLAF
ncbi:basic blue protein-like [Phragmites australis]|uniref:basic blue protein-like n=1 Tax=Phragmites australis TaxID=29695 RepID=UPI002D79DCF8|nr:basic blue protein-like [Phragmites australis]